MNHIKEEIILGGKTVTFFTGQTPKCLIVQPVDSHDMEEMQVEMEYIEQHSGTPFTLAAVRIDRWNAELTPWPAPPVFGKTPFGDGAAATLEFIVGKVLPLVNVPESMPVIIGGYSLAGLFALWASTQTGRFTAVAAASPSVWYKDWLDFSAGNRIRAERVYLSLGDRENHSKNALMATVGEAVRKQKAILDGEGVTNVLEWNQGNHFTDNGLRTAKGFVWCMTGGNDFSNK